MAFWGVEVKPGKPFNHAPISRRLHLSQATLGMGKAMQKSIVQCNVGNKSPVFVCCLFPEKAECCQLNLEFEEAAEVVFSVIGPRSVHLTGYYLHNSSHSRSNDDESESYGEDIADTETERSENGEESEYESSFIDDEYDEPQIVPSSPESASKSNDELFDLKKSNGKGKQKRRLRKTYQLSESESNDSSQSKVISNAAAKVFDSETEDTWPISSLCGRKHASDSGKIDVKEKPRKKTVNTEIEDAVSVSEGSNAAGDVLPGNKSGTRNEDKKTFLLGVFDGTLKKKREELAKEEKFPEAEQTQKLASNEKQNLSHVKLVAFTQVGLEHGAKLKRKRKEQAEEKTFDDNVAEKDKGQKNAATNRQVEDNKKRKRKKKSKDKDDGRDIKMEPPISSGSEKNRFSVDMESKIAKNKIINLSNGMVIEELEIGKPYGKLASIGKKVRIRYTGKLKESGQVIDSSADKSLLKFRLGGEEVPELWNIGLDGMRIGGKRRLTVPPSMSYKSEGANQKIPANAWLVFDVELVKVR